MRRSPACRRGSDLLVLAVSILLAMPAAVDARSVRGPAGPASGPAVSLDGRLAFWLSELWLRVSGGKNGCGLDPNGRCSDASSTAENGCLIDPSGRCAPAAATTENGCGLDPHGHCAGSPVAAKNGCVIEPNGRCATARTITDNGCSLDPGGRCGH